MYQKAKVHPNAVGSLLEPTVKEKVVKTFYNRFHYQYGLTPAFGQHASVTRVARETVDQVLDALEINGYIVVKSNSVTD